MVKIAYTQYGIVGPPAVTRRTLPSPLQQNGALYSFLTYLLHKQNYWAAAHVMTACFQLSDVDCVRIWGSAAGFIQGGLATDDEPTACCRITILQTVMTVVFRPHPTCDAHPHKPRLVAVMGQTTDRAKAARCSAANCVQGRHMDKFTKSFSLQDP